MGIILVFFEVGEAMIIERDGVYGYYDGVPKEYYDIPLEQLEKEIEEEKARCLAMAEKYQKKKRTKQR